MWVTWAPYAHALLHMAPTSTVAGQVLLELKSDNSSYHAGYLSSLQNNSQKLCILIYRIQPIRTPLEMDLYFIFTSERVQFPSGF